MKSNNEIKLTFKMGPHLIQISTILVVILIGFWSALVIVGRYGLCGNAALVVALSPLILLPVFYPALRQTLNEFSLASITPEGLNQKDGRIRSFREAKRFEFYSLGSLLLPKVYFPNYSFTPTPIMISAHPQVVDIILNFIEKSDDRTRIVTNINLGFKKQRTYNAIFIGGFGCMAGAAGWFLMGPGLCLGLAVVPIAIAVFRLSKPAPEFESLVNEYRAYRMNQMRPTH